MASEAEETSFETQSRPSITGLSPKEGVPGTQIKIRGENLGTSQSDLLVLSICGTDCLMSAKWKSPSLIVARVGQAKRGIGEIILVTKSMGRSVSSVRFRVFIVQVGPLEESAVWVDESRTVPGREAVRNIPETIETVDALGLAIEPQKKMEQSTLMQMFPEGSGNLRMENFSPAWFLLDNHRETSLPDLHKGLANLTKNITEEDSNSDIHRANLYALISCVDALADCHSRMQLEKNTRGWPLTQTIFEKLTESSSTANGLFHEVLSRKDRADATRNALSVLTRFRFIFFLPSAIDQNLSKGEYSTILNDYARAKSLFKETDVPLFKEVMCVLDSKMEVFKSNMKKRLIDMPASFEDQSKLIKYLKILEPDSDPAWDCITAYHCWLEDLLWQTQFKHYEMVVDGRDHSRLEFVESIVNLITDKLQTFWKLAQVYSASSTNQNYIDRQFDISQMLINTINVSSWLMLNALVPSSLPDAVISQYKEQFVEWPVVGFKSMSNQLFSSLKVLRNCISAMLDSNFTTEHLQPLIELSITIRLKCLSNIIEKTNEGVSSLTDKENWKLESLPSNSSKTVLPDLFENELNESLPAVKQILSFSGFPGELDLFSREAFRPILTSLFTSMITSVRDCIKQLVQLRGDLKRPSDFNSNKLSSKKLLISVCNIEYIINNSLPLFCKRLSDNGVNYGDLIFEQSKAKLSAFRKDLIKFYLQLKCAAFSSLIDSAIYTGITYEDASDFIKELLMCLVFIQSELSLLAPQLSQEILSPAVQTAFVELLGKLAGLESISREQATQLVVDVTALEESLQNFLSLETRAALNAFRARLIDTVDQKHFQRCLRNFRAAMRMAIASLSCVATNALNETSEVSMGTGYEKGNRLRVVAVIKLELIMLPFSLLAYKKVASYFSHDQKTNFESSSFFSFRPRGIFLFLVVLWLLLAHLAYLLFYLPEGVRTKLSYLSNMSAGIWSYFVPIMIGLSVYSFVIGNCTFLVFMRSISQLVLHHQFVKRLLTDERFQLKVVTSVSIILSLVTHLSSKHVFVKEVAFTIKHLPSEAANLRFALISDLHAGGCVGREQIAQVVEIVNSQNVDGVFIVGDAVDGTRNETFDRLGPLQFLNSKFGTFYVSGNHEYYYGNALEWFRQLRDYGVNVLDNKHTYLNGVCLAGVNDYSSGQSGIDGHKFDPSKALKGCSSRSSVIVLSHNPNSAGEIIMNSEQIPVDLILSGHTHAGQFYTMAPFVYLSLPYFHGTYKIGETTQLFVSAGTLYQGPPMKMVGFSEIWIVTLRTS